MRRRLFALGFFLAWLLGSAPLSGASFSLTPEEMGEAIRVGQQSVFVAEFGKEWEVVNPGGESLTVVTPFHRLALAARNAALKKGALKPREVEALLKEHQGKLFFWARLHGGGADFARHYQPLLLLPEREEVKPSFVQNELTALRLQDGRYLARCVYTFPTQGLRPNSRITLLVRHVDGRDIARFTVDLGAMR